MNINRYLTRHVTRIYSHAGNRAYHGDTLAVRQLHAEAERLIENGLAELGSRTC